MFLVVGRGCTEAVRGLVRDLAADEDLGIFAAHGRDIRPRDDAGLAVLDNGMNLGIDFREMSEEPVAVVPVAAAVTLAAIRLTGVEGSGGVHGNATAAIIAQILRHVVDAEALGVIGADLDEHRFDVDLVGIRHLEQVDDGVVEIAARVGRRAKIRAERLQAAR